jgi:hypothetical protein
MTTPGAEQTVPVTITVINHDFSAWVYFQ